MTPASGRSRGRSRASAGRGCADSSPTRSSFAAAPPASRCGRSPAADARRRLRRRPQHPRPLLRPTRDPKTAPPNPAAAPRRTTGAHGPPRRHAATRTESPPQADRRTGAAAPGPHRKIVQLSGPHPQPRQQRAAVVFPPEGDAGTRIGVALELRSLRCHSPHPTFDCVLRNEIVKKVCDAPEERDCAHVQRPGARHSKPRRRDG